MEEQENKSLAEYIFGKRKVRIIERDGEPWFVAKDVCDILGLENVAKALQNLADDERNTLTSSKGIHEGRGNPNLNIINEPGLYRLIFQSRKPEAEAFKRWVFHEVLPSIRKTGSYSALKKDHETLQRVCYQASNFRMKYLNLLDKLEHMGMTVNELWELGKIDHAFITEYRKKMITDKKDFAEGSKWGGKPQVECVARKDGTLEIYLFKE